MITLYEGILADMEDTLNVGDKYEKDYKLAHKEFDNLISICGNPKNWKGSEWERDPNNLVSMRYAGVIQDFQIFIKCSKLLKHFRLPARNMFIQIHFTPADKEWSIEIELTNSHQPTVNPNRTDGTIFVKNHKHMIVFTLKELSYVNGINKRSKYSIDDIIEKYLMPKLKDLNTFENEIVKPFIDVISKNQYGKYLPMIYI